MTLLHHLRLLSAPAAFACACITLTGCATAPATVEVKVPVYVPCVKNVPVRPAFASLALPGDASEGDKVQALARDTLLHFKYEGQLEAAIAGCI